VPNSQGRRVWLSLGWVWMSRSKDRDARDKKMENCWVMQPRHPPAATEWNTLAANKVMHQETGPFRCCRSMISAACLRFMFGKTSLTVVSPVLILFSEIFKRLAEKSISEMTYFVSSGTETLTQSIIRYGRKPGPHYPDLKPGNEFWNPLSGPSSGQKSLKLTAGIQN